MAAQASFTFFATRYWISLMPRRPPADSFDGRTVSEPTASPRASRACYRHPRRNRRTGDAERGGAGREARLRGVGRKGPLGGDFAGRPARTGTRPPAGGAGGRGGVPSPYVRPAQYWRVRNRLPGPVREPRTGRGPAGAA